MILCVQGPRAVLPVPTTEVVPFTMRTDTHLGFSSPTAPCCLHSPPKLWDPTEDLRAIARTFHYLDISGWYWGAITATEAQSVLQEAQEGTFLIRDSSHPLYMLTLSVKTGRGPTNVRIEYSHGRFRLDSSSLAKPRLLAFPDVASLVQHYVGSSQGEVRCKEDQPMPKGSALLLKLARPLHRSKSCPSLQHLTRLTINRLTRYPDQLPLPRPLQRYLQDYPFHL
ncbi:cytokine-inducible SH2-containing protein [Anguilla anguilla]|uniref:Cytokine-inducible SH2-containing protein n=2 Tax=Anguilla anguilla TaxID=7936 RepID=A0A9D3LYE0_ANGAN|nr:cytokine-inducible SH2-containing protein [Anguilla anguilla]KAG5838447.1 hypothetical protein ANANG_G00223800 [Anguilla anguilla]